MIKCEYCRSLTEEGSKFCPNCGARLNGIIVNNEEEVKPVVNNTSSGFRMVVEDVFNIMGRGVVATGTVESGSIKINSEAKIVKNNGEIIPTIITGIEMFRKSLDYTEAGDNVGLLLAKVDRNMVERGDVITD